MLNGFATGFGFDFAFLRIIGFTSSLKTIHNANPIIRQNTAVGMVMVEGILVVLLDTKSKII